mgnify:FL=1
MADNEYPADEFDRLADTRTIRGTHRRKESNLKWWLALVAVVILAPTAGWAISTYIGSSEEKPAPTASAKPPSGAPGGASSTAGPGGESGSSGGNKPSESGKTSGSPSTDASATPSGQESSTSADSGTGRPVLVLNGSKKPGLAATGKQKLEKAGYTKVSANNYSGGSPAVSTVFYAKASDAQTAKQVAAALGIRPGNVVLSPKATGGDQIVVVLRADAR